MFGEVTQPDYNYLITKKKDSHKRQTALVLWKSFFVAYCEMRSSSTAISSCSSLALAAALSAKSAPLSA